MNVLACEIAKKDTPISYRIGKNNIALPQTKFCNQPVVHSAPDLVNEILLSGHG
jgi:hypothetical protein